MTFDLKKALVNVKAALPKDKDISRILFGCGFVNDKDDWRRWQNEAYKLRITSKNKILIIEKKYKSVRISDIYAMSQVYDVLNIATNFLFDLNRNELILLCNDSFIRQYNYSEKWTSSVLCVKPLERLRLLFSNDDFGIKDNYYYGKACKEISSSCPELLRQLLETIPCHTEEIIE